MADIVWRILLIVFLAAGCRWLYLVGYNEGIKYLKSITGAKDE